MKGICDGLFNDVLSVHVLGKFNAQYAPFVFYHPEYP